MSAARPCCTSTFGNPHAAGCGFKPRPDDDFDYRAPVVELGAPSALATVLHREIMQHLDELVRVADATTGSAWRQWGMTLMASPDGHPEDADRDHATEVARFVTVRDGHPRTHDMNHVQQWQPKIALAIVRYWRAQANAWLQESGLNPGHELALRRLAGMQVLLTVDMGLGR